MSLHFNNLLKQAEAITHKLIAKMSKEFARELREISNLRKAYVLLTIQTTRSYVRESNTFTNAVECKENMKQFLLLNIYLCNSVLNILV